MNYRHAFHAGNHADVLKHWALSLCLARLGEKPAPFAALDTHAGAGMYDLTGEAAQRSPEWRDGIARLITWADPPASLHGYLDLVRGFNPEGELRRYPGSPAIIARALRPPDRLIACELHRETFAALRGALQGPTGQLALHERDGFAAIAALTPPKERRGLILIDPPYEDRGLDLRRSVAAIAQAHARFRQAIVIWWRPLKSEAELAAADAEIRALKPDEAIRADLRVGAGERLMASSLIVIHPPHTLRAALAEAGAPLAQRLSQDPEAGFSLRTL